MKAWQLDSLGGNLTLNDIATPEVRPGSVLVRIEASALMSYLKAYVEGQLLMYNPPKGGVHSWDQWGGRGACSRTRCLAPEAGAACGAVVTFRGGRKY